MGLDRLQVFLRVAHTRSFSRAAELLRIERTRASRVVAALEDELGTRLLVRTTRSVTLTRDGEALVRRITEPLAELERALAAVPAEATIPRGEVTLTATADVGRTLLPPVLARCRARYPTIQLRLVLSDELVGEAGGADLALRFGRPGGAAVVARLLARYETGLYAAPSYLDRRGTPGTLSELGRHDGLWPAASKRRSFAPSSAPPPPVIACSDFAALAALAAAGAGIAVLPTFVAATAVTRGELCRVLPAVALGQAPLYLVSAPPRRLAARVGVVRTLLLELLGTGSAARSQGTVPP